VLDSGNMAKKNTEADKKRKSWRVSASAHKALTEKSRATGMKLVALGEVAAKVMTEMPNGEILKRFENL